MNSKKKIIETLKAADKASVERLMEEQAKKEAVFARVQKKTADHNDYTDVAEGVEKYERKINMTRIISAAAAMVVVLGAIGGGAYLRRNKGPKTPEDVLTAPTTTAVSTDAAVTTAALTTVTGKNVSTVTVTAAAGGSAVTTTSAEAATAKITEAVNEKPAVTTAPQSSDTNTEEKVLAELREYSQLGEYEEKIYKEYARIIDECSTMIKNRDTSGLKYGDRLSVDFIVESQSGTSTPGYAFYDVNEDGISELLLGVNNDMGTPYGGPGSFIYDIFSVNSSGEVYSAANGGTRDSYFVCTNPTADRPADGMQHGAFIGNIGSGGAYLSANSYYRLSSDGLRLVESVFCDGIDENFKAKMYYTTEAEFTDKSDKISTDEANNIINSYSNIFIDFTPFE